MIGQKLVYAINFLDIDEREGMDMASTTKAAHQASDEKDQTDATQKTSWLTTHPNFISLATLLIAIGSVLIAYGKFSEKVDSYGNDISEIRASISEINNEIKGISNDVSALTARSNAMEKDIDLLNQAIFCYRPTSAFASTITGTYSGIDAPYNSGPIRLGSASIIAYSKNIPDKEYTVGQLADQALLLPYSSGNQETYFYGQLDEPGNWDGHCIVNIYENNELSLITDAQYDRGKLLSCKQAFPESLPNGDDIWVISNRTIKDGFSEGETWRYFRDGDYKKDFTIDSVTVSDIIDADTFKLNNAGALEGYYSGNISNGSYNDNTGNAYYVQYLRDGTVETLYVGKFEKGNFQDTTGNAWMIGNDGEGTPYCYYKGPFNGGYPIKDSKYWEQPLTVHRTQEIISDSGMKFNCELKWENDTI